MEKIVELDIQELSVEEIDQVDGAGLASVVGYLFGRACGMGGAMMQSVNNSGDMMLSAMQYGA